MNTCRNHAVFRQPVYGLLAGFFLALVLFLPPLAKASVNIANSPLFLTTSVGPNIMFIIDDSGSMHYEVTPDEEFRFGSFDENTRWVYPRVNNVYGSGNYNSNVATVDNHVFNARARSPQVNKTYYNPSITYTPWVRYNGTLYPNADPKAAYHNPENTVRGYRNLTVSNTNTNTGGLVDSVLNRWRTCDGPSAAQCSTQTNNKTFWPATYFWYTGGETSTERWSLSNYDGPFEIRESTSNYSGHGRENRTDCTGGVCTYAQEIQNFANWYTYYRSRILASRAGIGHAFVQQGENMRIGYGAINAAESNVDGVTTGTIVRGVRPFIGTHREAFFDELYTRAIPAAGTPLRRALDDAGQYFSRIDYRGPWSTTPGEPGGTDLECRQSYTILMTDGYWSGTSTHEASAAAARANVDNSLGPSISAPDGTTYQYTPTDPYRDSYSNTLADVAMYYWSRDLRPDLDNKVPTSPQNEAYWQHVVTFGVGLGVFGSIDPVAAWSAVNTKTEIEWPNTNPSSSNCSGAECPARLDDLLHAAINSRGGFFSAEDPDSFATELTGVLEAIFSRVESSATSAAASSAVLQSDTLLYTAGFRSSDWSGQLQAHHLEEDGSLGSLAWDAEAELLATGPSNRKIFTSNDATGNSVALAFGNLSPAQQAALNHAPNGVQDNLGLDRIAWIRGDDTAHSSFRSRSATGGELRLLGDIVNSDPQFLSRTDFGYALLSGTEGSTYLEFRDLVSYQQRPDVLFVGANDGMLHAFDGQTGEELFAYIPGALLLPDEGNSHALLSELMDAEYSHRYFVDGTAVVGDAFWEGSWKTVLVGTTGAGGRTVFALDVSNPGAFGASNRLWEFTDPHLGYNVGQPSIVRMNNGKWAAVFGNGYNSEEHKAVLFVVDIGTGSLIAKIDTAMGSTEQPNGLASPLVSDWPELDLKARRIYAGDLHGHLWRFDISDSDPNKWAAEILFQAQDADEQVQPITARPAVGVSPDNKGTLIVIFGTGSYFRLEDGDLSDPQVQTLYGVFDTAEGATVSGRSELLEQTLTWQGTETFTTAEGPRTYELRKVSKNALSSEHRGWYLDLVYDGNVEGERVINEPTFPSGPAQRRIRFTTLIPDNDPCGTGRRGFLMDIDLFSGAMTKYSVFDLNRDGNFDSADRVNDEFLSGLGFGQGEKLTIIRSPQGRLEYGYSGDGGDGEPLASEPGQGGRHSWRQLR